MNVLIIENEKPAADKIVRLLKKVDKSITVAGIIESVEGSVNRLQQEPLPDLILMDIQLDDGLCFEIFDTICIDIPVIFTTAYDQYMLKAFKVNSIDYLLKPIEEASLRNAINKFNSLHRKDTLRNDLLRGLYKELYTGYKNRFLVKIGTNYRSVQVSEISCIYILERAVFIRTFADADYSIDYSLDTVQKTLDPTLFFRINRDYIVNVNAISDIISYSSSRLKIRLNSRKPIDDLIVSRDKVSEFKKWIDK
jgi:two-component system, LytTR family, response regulator LytT